MCEDHVRSKSQYITLPLVLLLKSMYLYVNVSVSIISGAADYLEDSRGPGSKSSNGAVFSQ